MEMLIDGDVGCWKCCWLLEMLLIDGTDELLMNRKFDSWQPTTFIIYPAVGVGTTLFTKPCIVFMPDAPLESIMVMNNAEVA